MTFTDEDLKQLKCGNMYLVGGDTEALILRLEAAEKALGMVLYFELAWGAFPEFYAWRKAAGK